MTPETFDRWWQSIARVAGFIVGVIIIMGQADAARDRLPVILAAIGLCGPFVAQSVAIVLTAYRGGGSTE